jgi:glycolate oxidase FAD binding subunit
MGGRAALAGFGSSRPNDPATGRALGGHATLFRNHAATDPVFQPLPPAMLALQQRIKQALDPHALFNPGRLYPEL